jgi:beta-lactamase regulating signal transducer with metallopeptidase domain
MVFSIILAVVGAILAFAVTVTAKGLNLNTVGVILLVVGILGFLVSLFVVFVPGSRRSTLQEDVRQVPGGEQRVVERRDHFAADL